MLLRIQKHKKGASKNIYHEYVNNRHQNAKVICSIEQKTHFRSGQQHPFAVFDELLSFPQVCTNNALLTDILCTDSKYIEMW